MGGGGGPAQEIGALVEGEEEKKNSSTPFLVWVFIFIFIFLCPRVELG